MEIEAKIIIGILFLLALFISTGESVSNVRAYEREQPDSDPPTKRVGGQYGDDN